MCLYKLRFVLLISLPLCAQSPSEILSAAARAYASHEPDPTVRNPDWLADPLLGPSEIALLTNHPMGRAVNQDFRIAALDPEVSGLARPILVATRYIDDHLTEAVRSGFSQVVILNAGFDSRAYRFRSLLRDKHVSEIDDPATQELKKQRIETILEPLPPYVSYVPMETTDPAIAILRQAMVDPRARTVFIWEGATMRYTEARVREILQAIAIVAPRGSIVLTDFVTPEQVANPPRWFADWKEPWRFGTASIDFVRNLGLTPSDVLPTESREASRRYLTRRDGTIFGPAPNSPGTGLEAAYARTMVTLTVS